MKKILLTFLVAFISMHVFNKAVHAHVVVKPQEVGVSSFQTFTIGVPVEKDIATTQVRLVIPDGLNHITPNLKSSWTVNTTTMDEGDHAKITEIIWSGNSIPAGYREDFQFSAQVPADPTSLSWKAYQTYEDGSVVAWELDPTAEQPTKEDGTPDFSVQGPASETKVVNDLEPTVDLHTEHEEKANNAFYLSIFAVALSTMALALQLFKTKK